MTKIKQLTHLQEVTTQYQLSNKSITNPKKKATRYEALSHLSKNPSSNLTFPNFFHLTFVSLTLSNNMHPFYTHTHTHTHKQTHKHTHTHIFPHHHHRYYHLLSTHHARVVGIGGKIILRLVHAVACPLIHILRRRIGGRQWRLRAGLHVLAMRHVILTLLIAPWRALILG